MIESEIFAPTKIFNKNKFNNAEDYFRTIWIDFNTFLKTKTLKSKYLIFFLKWLLKRQNQHVLYTLRLESLINFNQENQLKIRRINPDSWGKCIM